MDLHCCENINKKIKGKKHGDLFNRINSNWVGNKGRMRKVVKFGQTKTHKLKRSPQCSRAKQNKKKILEKRGPSGLVQSWILSFFYYGRSLPLISSVSITINLWKSCGDFYLQFHLTSPDHWSDSSGLEQHQRTWGLFLFES